jgi:hypothetical protein
VAEGGVRQVIWLPPVTTMLPQSAAVPNVEPILAPTVPPNPLPAIVIDVPPPMGPLLGVTLVIVGGVVYV